MLSWRGLDLPAWVRRMCGSVERVEGETTRRSSLKVWFDDIA